MRSVSSRRGVLKALGISVVAGALPRGLSAAAPAFSRMPAEGKDTPKICLGFRNVVVRKPSVDYTEVFLDDGQVDLFGVMRELVRQKYPRAISPEHPRALDVDRERGAIRNQYPGGGGFSGEIYNVGYTRAMLQAALTL